MKRDPKDPDGQYERYCANDAPWYEDITKKSDDHETKTITFDVKTFNLMPNAIESPSHYTHGEREAIDYMRDIGVLEQYCVGNIFKYLYRYKHKANPTEDLLKAREYIDILVKELNNA